MWDFLQDNQLLLQINRMGEREEGRKAERDEGNIEGMKEVRTEETEGRRKERRKEVGC